jgi:tRNA U34 5-methylaminomethyl-2-thiouridine-forming methyltransferase MnmC
MRYNLFRINDWGTVRWVLAAPGCSTFGTYSSAAAARKDAKEYGLRVVRAEGLDAGRLWL